MNAVRIYYRKGEPQDPRFRYEVIDETDPKRPKILATGAINRDGWYYIRAALVETYTTQKDSRSTIYAPGLVEGYPPFMQNHIDGFKHSIRNGATAFTYQGFPFSVQEELADDNFGDSEDTVMVYYLGENPYSSPERLVEDLFHRQLDQ